MDDTIQRYTPEEIAIYIANLSISDTDKQFWAGKLSTADRDIASNMLTYFHAFPDKVGWATDILKRQIEALQTQDETAWDQILTEEEQEIAHVTDNEQRV
jgi:succinate dehydrogenase flavin-adding protein (antitoxin of CptAB toxin-antitoxin module)